MNLNDRLTHLFSHTEASSRRGILLLEWISALIGGLLAILVVIDLASGFYALAVAATLISLIAFGIRELSRHEHHKLAARALILAVNVVIFGYAGLLGKAALVQNYFFPAIGLPILVCVSDGWACILAGTALPVALYSILEATHYLPFGRASRIPAPSWSAPVNVLACFAVIFLIIFEFFWLARRAEEDLRNEQRKLLAASKLSALGEMAGSIAHEINNPLSNIMLLAGQIRNLTEKDPLSRDQLARCAQNVQDTVMRISTIVRALNMMARNTERDPMKRESVAKIVHETCGLCLDKFASQGVDLRILMSASGATVECNPTQISQVLINLLNNAFDAVQGAPSRWVQVEAVDRDDYVELAVADSGPGMPAAARARLFEPFFTSKEPGCGTGLGLTISAKIAREHHGELSLDPRSPRTRFRLWLPKEQLRVQPSGLVTSGRSREGADRDTVPRSWTP